MQWKADLFCVFSLDDAEEGLNDHEDGGIKENYREQDIYLPIANVARIMKNAVPQTGKVCERGNGNLNKFHHWYLMFNVSVAEIMNQSLQDFVHLVGFILVFHIFYFFQ